MTYLLLTYLRKYATDIALLALFTFALYLNPYTTLLYLVTLYITFFTTAVMYVSVMHFRILKETGRFDSLHWSTKALGYKMLYLGLIADLLLNIALSVPFLELPQWRSGELLTTGRIKRWYWNTNGGWRHRFAVFFAREYLLPFDPSHMD